MKVMLYIYNMYYYYYLFIIIIYYYYYHYYYHYFIIIIIIVYRIFLKPDDTRAAWGFWFDRLSALWLLMTGNGMTWFWYGCQDGAWMQGSGKWKRAPKVGLLRNQFWRLWSLESCWTKARKLLDRQHQAEEFRKQKRDQFLAWRELAT